MIKKKYNMKGRILFCLLVIFFILFVIYIFSYNNSKKRITIKNKESQNEYINIPEGFYYVGGTIDTGVVISDNKDDYNKGTDYETTLKLKGNQYVWIPVDTPVAENEDDLLNLIKNNKYPLAIESGKNYRGVLYNYTLYEEDEPFTIYKGEYDNKESESDSNREPAILTMSLYGDSEEFIKYSTENLYQESFNKMVESVKSNGGFFVSRYELGNLHTGALVSKPSQTDISNMSWVDGYNSIKKMYNSNSVSTDIIWGCQWDAIMIWLYYTDENKLYFKQNTNDLCNHSGGVYDTASNSKYCNNNIFDLIGNVSEFTQEAAYSSIRISRGGSYDYESEVLTPNIFLREKISIVYPYSNVGFRSVLIF